MNKVNNDRSSRNARQSDLLRLPTDLLCNVVEYFACGNIAALSRSSRLLNSKMTTIAGSILSAIKDRSIYEKPALYRRCVASKYLSQPEEAIKNNVGDQLKVVKVVSLAGAENIYETAFSGRLVVPQSEQLFLASMILAAPDEVLDNFLPLKGNAMMTYAVRECIDNHLFTRLLTDGRVCPTGDSNEPLKAAAHGKEGKIDLVKILLSDPRINPKIDSGDILGKVENTDILQVLLADGRCDPTADDYLACRTQALKGNYDCCMILLADERLEAVKAMQIMFDYAVKGYEVEGTTWKGFGPLIKAMLANPAIDPTANTHAAIKTASKRHSTTLTNLLLSHERVDPTVDDHKLFFHVVEFSTPEIIGLWLDDVCIDPTFDDHYAISVACAHNQTYNLIRLLKDHRLNPNVDEQHLFANAIHKGDKAVVKLMLSHPLVDPTSDSYAMFKEAIEKSTVSILQLFLDDPRIDPTLIGGACLENIIAMKRFDAFEVLMTDGRIDPSQNDNRAFKLAVEHDCEAMVEVLLKDPRVDGNIQCKSKTKKTTVPQKIQRLIYDWNNPIVKEPKPEPTKAEKKEKQAKAKKVAAAKPNTRAKTAREKGKNKKK